MTEPECRCRYCGTWLDGRGSDIEPCPIGHDHEPTNLWITEHYGRDATWADEILDTHAARILLDWVDNIPLHQRPYAIWHCQQTLGYQQAAVQDSLDQTWHEITKDISHAKGRLSSFWGIITGRRS